jgi:hypothetical protein
MEFESTESSGKAQQLQALQHSSRSTQAAGTVVGIWQQGTTGCGAMLHRCRHKQLVMHNLGRNTCATAQHSCTGTAVCSRSAVYRLFFASVLSKAADTHAHSSAAGIWAADSAAGPDVPAAVVYLIALLLPALSAPHARCHMC